MLNIITRRQLTLLILLLVVLLMILLVLTASGQQVSLPFTGIQSNRQVMPPDPNEWCRKIDLEKLFAELEKAETFVREGVGERFVDWRYLRRALKMTGVQVNGPEDWYWLERIKGLYAGCKP